MVKLNYTLHLRQPYIYGKKTVHPIRNPPHIRPLWLSKNPEKFFNLTKSQPYYTEHPYVVKFHLPETYRSGETVISPCLIFGKYMLDNRQSFEKTTSKSLLRVRIRGYLAVLGVSAVHGRLQQQLILQRKPDKRQIIIIMSSCIYKEEIGRRQFMKGKSECVQLALTQGPPIGRKVNCSWPTT